MNLNKYLITSIRTDQVAAMPKSRVVKLIIVGLNYVLVAKSHGHPVWAVLFDQEGHLYALGPLVAYCWLHQAEVVVVSLHRLNGIVRDYFDSIVLEFGAEFELNMRIK